MRATVTAMALGLALLPAIALGAGTDNGNASADGRYTAPNGPPPDSTARLGAQPTSEAQARGLLSANGYAVTSGLSRSADGTWRARAMKNGAAMDVGVDPSGRILAN